MVFQNSIRLNFRTIELPRCLWWCRFDRKSMSQTPRQESVQVPSLRCCSVPRER
jgi:hypothetical protein